MSGDRLKLNEFMSDCGLNITALFERVVSACSEDAAALRIPQDLCVT